MRFWKFPAVSSWGSERASGGCCLGLGSSHSCSCPPGRLVHQRRKSQWLPRPVTSV